MTEDLFSPADVKRVREILVQEQNNLCALTNVPTHPKDYHLDHRHDDEQLVRSALHKQSNMALGKLEGLWVRYLSYWYPGTLSDFLRAAADYLERPVDRRWRHPGWKKKLATKFNKLSSKQRQQTLDTLGWDTPCSNDTARKKAFDSLLNNRLLGYNAILNAINKSKE